MVKESYCKFCQKEVQLKKKAFSWAMFFGWTVLSFGTLFWVYPIYRLCVQNTRCQICGSIIVGWNLKPLFKKDE